MGLGVHENFASEGLVLAPIASLSGPRASSQTPSLGEWRVLVRGTLHRCRILSRRLSTWASSRKEYVPTGFSPRPRPNYFFPHFVSRTSPRVPPEIVSPSTGLPRKMILVSSLYSFGPDRFQALHGASIRHSLNDLAVQVKIWFGPSSARVGTIAPINKINAIDAVKCRVITPFHKKNPTWSQAGTTGHLECVDHPRSSYITVGTSLPACAHEVVHSPNGSRLHLA
jgi:hypothetical protein